MLKCAEHVAINGSILNCTPGDPKLVTSQFPRKVSIQITLHQRLQKKSKRKQWLILLLKRVSFLKNTTSFSFCPLPYSRASNLSKIFANFSREIVTSSSVLDHRTEIFKSSICFIISVRFPGTKIWCQIFQNMPNKVFSVASTNNKKSWT